MIIPILPFTQTGTHMYDRERSWYFEKKKEKLGSEKI